MPGRCSTTALHSSPLVTFHTAPWRKLVFPSLILSFTFKHDKSSWHGDHEHISFIIPSHLGKCPGNIKEGYAKLSYYLALIR